jgi:glutathione S-transferase
MPKLVLTYFDLDGSRGEVARLAMHLAGIAFVDKRVAGKDWPALRESTPFQSLPVLEVDGQVIAQSVQASFSLFIKRLKDLVF